MVTVLCFHSLHIKTSDIACFSPAAGGKALGAAKLFDSMAKLKFKEEEAGQPTKEAVGMYVQQGRGVRDPVIPAHVRGTAGADPGF